MRIINNTLALLLGFSLLAPLALFAQTGESMPAKSGAVISSGVTIKEPFVASQVGLLAKVSFTIANAGTQAQAGVRYAVELREKGGTAVVDRRVYSERLTIAGGNTVAKENIEYYAPNYLKGDYDVWVVVATEGGLLLSALPAGTMKLIGTGKFIELSDCSLSDQAVAAGKPLTVTCTAQNNFATDKTVTAHFSVFRDSVYGPVVGIPNVKNDSINLGAGASKKISLAVPLPDSAGQYSVRLSLTETNTEISNVVMIPARRAGATGTIMSVSADKASYAAGDTAHVSVFIRASIPAVILDLAMIDAKGVSCSQGINGKRVEGITGAFDMAVTSACDNPTIVAHLSDEEGNMLDQKTLKLSGTPETALPPANRTAPWTFGLAIIGLAAVAFVITIISRIKRGGRPRIK